MSKFDAVEKMLAGDRLGLARVISHIENRGDNLRQVMDRLYAKTGNAFILGITGPPGAGKSTVTDRLIAAIRQKGDSVAVVCIDPSSPFSGGAILGDRIRMQAHTGDAKVYIRSLGTRGKHGGLSHATKDVVMALDAAGFQWILVETAGVGQTELDILKLAHGVCVVLVPESGDGIQMMKAGLMEIADIFVVNKSDRPEADKVVKEVLNMIGLSPASSVHAGEQGDAVWIPPVVKTQAVFAQGIDELFAAIERYKEHAHNSGRLERKRAAFLTEEVLEIVTEQITKNIRQKISPESGSSVLNDLINKAVTPHEVAERLLKGNT